MTNRNHPISLSIPFTDELLKAGIHIIVAAKLYEEGILTLSKAAALANMSVESFMKKMANFGIIVVDQSAEELDADLGAIGD